MLRVYNSPFDVLDSLFVEFDSITKSSDVNYYEDVRTYSDGKTKKTFRNGILHSVGGKPAIIEYNDKGQIQKETYFWEGEKVSKDFVDTKLQEIEDNKEHIISLGGKQYKVKGKKLKELEKTLGLEPLK